MKHHKYSCIINPPVSEPHPQPTGMDDENQPPSDEAFNTKFGETQDHSTPITMLWAQLTPPTQGLGLEPSLTIVRAQPLVYKRGRLYYWYVIWSPLYNSFYLYFKHYNLFKGKFVLNYISHRISR